MTRSLADYDINWFEQANKDIHENKIRHNWKVTTSEDWNDPDEIPAVLMQINSEISEAFEAFRKNDRANFDEELADIVIRVMGLAHGMGIDLKRKIIDKVIKNKNREYRHGNKRL